MSAPVTKADLFQRIEDLKSELAEVRAWADRKQDDANRATAASEARWKARDPESVAIDRCVRALDDYMKAASSSTYSSAPHRDVTRLLLFLAARYSARVVPQPEPDPSLAVVARLQQLELDASNLRRQVTS